MAMSGFEDISVQNQEAIEEIARTIRWSEGQFVLVLARCNYGDLRDRAIDRLRNEFPGIVVLEVPQGAVSLLDWLREAIGGRTCSAAMVVGLEGVADLPGFLSTANQIRESFREDCPFPLVLWATDGMMESLTRFAPDFESWGTTTRFEISVTEIEKWLEKRVDEWFSGELATSFPPQATWAAMENEFLTAATVIQKCSVLPKKISLGWRAALGGVYQAQWKMEDAINCFEQALQDWEEDTWQVERIKVMQGIVDSYHIKVTDQRDRNHPDWIALQKSMENLIQFCRSQGHLEYLVPEVAGPLGELLKQFEQWELLKILIQEASSRFIGFNPLSVQVNRFLAEVAIAERDWGEALKQADQALLKIEHIKASNDFNQPMPKGSLNILHPTIKHLEPLCQVLIAEAKKGLGDIDGSILILEQARGNSSTLAFLRQHLDILSELERLYRLRNNYLKAFEAKQERFSVEQQMGIRAFIGAGCLSPEQNKSLNLSTLSIEFGRSKVSTAIQSSLRSQDMENLLIRVGGTEHKLTVLHGASGVGKSSLVGAGLLPTLMEKAIGTRDNRPILIRQYTNWEEELLKILGEDSDNSSLIEQILKKLEWNEVHALRTVLIFDQFEEFFFTNIDRSSRQCFYHFLGCTLNPKLSNLKIILSMREDYLPYLLECRTAPGMENINRDVLGRSVLYEIGNFSPEDARSIIEDLTTRSQFILEPALIDRIVSDLSEPFGEVRPIELQIVGAQLQSEGIQTLAAYPRGGKSALVDDYLMSVVKDCGPDNEQLATWVAYLLTDERGTRPLKTRLEIERELEELLPSVESTDLDLVLAVLVGSGLVLRSKEMEGDRYQLVHDYLAGVIHERQKFRVDRLGKELEEERKKSQELKQGLRKAMQELTVVRKETARTSQERETLQREIEGLSKRKKDLEDQVSTHNNHLDVWTGEYNNEIKIVKEKNKLLKERMIYLEEFYSQANFLAYKLHYLNQQFGDLVGERFNADSHQRLSQLVLKLSASCKTLSENELQLSEKKLLQFSKEKLRSSSKTDPNQASFWKSNFFVVVTNLGLMVVFASALGRIFSLTSGSFFLLPILMVLMGSYMLWPKQNRTTRTVTKKKKL
jgi:hypothetical protein